MKMNTLSKPCDSHPSLEPCRGRVLRGRMALLILVAIVFGAVSSAVAVDLPWEREPAPWEREPAPPPRSEPEDRAEPPVTRRGKDAPRTPRSLTGAFALTSREDWGGGNYRTFTQTITLKQSGNRVTGTMTITGAGEFFDGTEAISGVIRGNRLIFDGGGDAIISDDYNTLGILHQGERLPFQRQRKGKDK